MDIHRNEDMGCSLNVYIMTMKADINNPYRKE